MGKLLTAAVLAAGAYVAYRAATAKFMVVMRAKAMTGKVAVVTGGTSGVGKEACKRLISNGVKVIIGARDMVLGMSVAKEMQAYAPIGYKDPVAECIHLDLSSLSSVSKFASDVLAMDLPINILLLNAGMYPAQGQTEAAYTADGFEVCFQTNHLSHHLLAKLLTDRVKSSAPARIVTTSSSLHSPSNQRHGSGDRPMVKCGSEEEMRADWQQRLNGSMLYRNSKLANILFAYELDRRLKGSGVTSNALSPGFIPNTGLSRHQGGRARFFVKWIMPHLPFKFISTVEKGADCIEMVCLAPELEGAGGRYFHSCREAPSSEDSKDEKLAGKLWALSDRLVSSYL